MDSNGGLFSLSSVGFSSTISKYANARDDRKRASSARDDGERVACDDKMDSNGGLFSLSSVGFSSTISKYANRARNASYNARNDDRERLWCKSATEIICSLVDICKIFAFCGIGHYSIDLLGAFWQAL